MEDKLKINFLANFGIIIFIMILSTISYSALTSTMNVLGIANARFTKDVRVTRFSINEASSGTISSYEEFNKDTISTHITFPNTSSYIIYNVSVRNYGNVKMGIKEIVGQNSNLNYELIDYNLHDIIKDSSGNSLGGATKDFKIKISPKNSSGLELSTKLIFKFNRMYDVTYTLIQDNNYPKEAMEGVDFNLTFIDPVPKYVDVFINGNSTSNFTYNNPNLKINSVNGNINIKLSERAYLKKSGSGKDFKSNSNVRNQIKTVSFVKYDNSSDSTNLGTWDMSEGQDKSVMAWLDKDYNLFIGSKYKIYGKNFYELFDSLSSVTSFNFSNLYTSEVTDMMYMFYGCNSITKLDLSNFDIRKCYSFSGMFLYSKKIIEITIGNNYIFTNENAFPRSKYGTWYNSKKQLVTLEQISGHAGTYFSFISGVQLPLEKDKFRNSGILKLTGKITFSNDILPSGTTNTIFVSDNDSVVGVITGQDAVIYNTISGGGVIAPENCKSLFDQNKNILGNIKSPITSIDITGLNTSNVVNMSYMFYNCTALKELDLTSLDTSKVTNMERMIRDCRSLTKINLNGLNTSNVTNMNELFCGCSSLKTIDLSSFDTSNVIYMGWLFKDCKSLTSLDLSNLKTGNVTSMDYMFYGLSCPLDLSNFDTSNVRNMDYMFFQYNYDYLDLSSFNTSHVTEMNYMFKYSNIKNLNLSNFDTRSVTSADDMFDYNSPSIIKITIGNNYNLYDKSGILREGMFPNNKYGTWFNSNKQLVTLDQISGHGDTYLAFVPGVQVALDNEKFRNSGILKLTGKITFSTDVLPSGITNTISLNDNDTVVGFISGQDVVIYNTILSGGILAPPDCTSLFDISSNTSGRENSTLTSIDLTGFNTKNVIDMTQMFYECGNVQNIIFGNFSTSKVTGMSSMFSYCYNLQEIKFGNFDTSNVTIMDYMFYHCRNIKELDLRSFDTSKVTNMGSMFNSCNSLTSLDLSSFDFTNVTSIGYFLYNNAPSLTVYYNTQASLDKIKSSSNLNPNITFVQKNANG